MKEETHKSFLGISEESPTIKTEYESQIKIEDKFPEFNRRGVANNKMPSMLLENTISEWYTLRYIPAMWFNFKNIKSSGIHADKRKTSKKDLGSLNLPTAAFIV